MLIFAIVIAGKYYYKLNKKGIEAGYPREISSDWKGVKGPIDAALTWENGYTYIFKVQFEITSIYVMGYIYLYIKFVIFNGIF